VSYETKQFWVPIAQVTVSVMIALVVWFAAYSGLSEFVAWHDKRLDIMEPKIQNLEVRSAVQVEQNRQILERLDELRTEINKLSQRKRGE
jgi:hypothetical protein